MIAVKAEASSASACSQLSITAEIQAASNVMPLPEETESERDAGLTAEQTGMPITSRSVRSATRVMPKQASAGSRSARVSRRGAGSQST
ncbi:MAG: hypothetical protein E5W03_04105, partial [Mesorhizobium sp.]